MRTDYVEKHRVRRKSRSRIKFYLGIGIFAVLITSISAFFIHSPIFEVQSIEVSGLEGEKKEQFLARFTASLPDGKFLSLLGSGHYALWPHSTDFSDSEISSVAISKNFLHRKIMLTVTPREPFGVWCWGKNTNNCVWIDTSEGVVMQESPIPEGSLITTIYDPTDTRVHENKEVISLEVFNEIRHIISSLEEMGIPLAYFEVDRLGEELHAITTGGSQILFSTRADATPTAIRGLEALLLKVPLNKIQYADFTVENKVYVKRR